MYLAIHRLLAITTKRRHRHIYSSYVTCGNGITFTAILYYWFKYKLPNILVSKEKYFQINSIQISRIYILVRKKQRIQAQNQISKKKQELN